MKTSTMPEKGTEGRERLLAFMQILDDKREIVNYEINGNRITGGRADYLVLSDAEANWQTKEYIKDSLWAFNASFILEECGLDLSGEDSLKAMQEKSCESANDFILSLVKKTCGLDSFVEAAISADGRGHFLSSYDGEENEVRSGGQDWYVYRID